MKRVSRMLIFSAIAIYLTSLWNEGFIVNFNPYIFIRTVVLIALFYYLIMPLTKLVLLPINILTLGLISTVIYFLLFYFFITRFSLIKIEPWKFTGFTYNSIIVKPMEVNYITNVLLSSASLSFLINILELIV